LCWPAVTPLGGRRGAVKGRSRPPPRVHRINQPCLGCAPSGLCRDTFVPLLGTGVDFTFPLPVASGPPTFGLQGLLINLSGQKRENRYKLHKYIVVIGDNRRSAQIRELLYGSMRSRGATGGPALHCRGDCVAVVKWVLRHRRIRHPVSQRPLMPVTVSLPLPPNRHSRTSQRPCRLCSTSMV